MDYAKIKSVKGFTKKGKLNNQYYLKGRNMMIIGIAGGTGSGKTTLADILKKEFLENVSVIAYDNYYKNHDHLTLEERAQVNYDCPEALDTELLIQHLKALKQGKAIEMPIYNFKMHMRDKETIMVKPATIIVVEGILLFHLKELRDLFDLKIYVDVSADIRILRRVKRDIEERGRTIDSVTAQYLSTVQPMHDKYVEPTKKYADIILNSSLNASAISLISEKIIREIYNQNSLVK